MITASTDSLLLVKKGEKIRLIYLNMRSVLSTYLSIATGFKLFLVRMLASRYVK